MSNLMELQGQIDKLQKQANDIKAREFDKTVGEIKATMKAFGITVKDLTSTKASGKAKGTGKVAKSARATKADTGAKKAAKPVEAKVRGPNGESWSGRGLAPKWLTALMAEGKTKEEFAIKAA
jgi:DNA-binding protein H-NS